MGNIVKYELFKSKIDKPNGLEFGSVVHSQIYNWYKFNPDQRNLVAVENLAVNHTPDELREFNRFGIVDANVPGSIMDRESLIFINREVFKKLDAYVESFSNRYIRNNDYPTYYALEFELEDLNEFNKIKSILNEDMPGIRILNPPDKLLEADIQQDVMDKLIDGYRGYGFTRFIDITKYVTSIEDAFNGDNTDTIKKFNTAIEEIVKYHDGKTIFYSMKENMCYVNLAAHLNYFYKITCIFKNLGGIFRVTLGELCYSRDRMLADEKLKYLREFPTFTFKATDYSAYLGVTLNRKLSVTVRMCDIEDIEKGEILIQEIEIGRNYPEILSIEDLYDFRVDDSERSKLRSENERLKQLYIKFYKRLDGNIIPPNPCNTIFLRSEENGKTYIAYIGGDEHINFKTDMYVVDTGLNYLTKYQLKLDEVSSWIPLELCRDVVAWKKHLNKLIGTKLNKDLTQGEVLARRNTKPMTSLLRGFYMNKSNRTISGLVNYDFIEACLNCEDSVKFRISNGQSILRKLSIGEELQSKLNCFSCHDIILDDIVRVSEKTFMRKQNLK